MYQRCISLWEQPRPPGAPGLGQCLALLQLHSPQFSLLHLSRLAQLGFLGICISPWGYTINMGFYTHYVESVPMGN